MAVLNSPAQIPRAARYRIVGRPDLAERLAGLLSQLRPGHGIDLATPGPGFAAAPDDAGLAWVLCGPDWAGPAAALDAAGVDRRRISVLPLPVADCWGWWQLAQRAGNHLLPDGRIDLDGASFYRSLGKLDESGPVPTVDACRYNVYFGETLRPHLDAIGRVHDRLADRPSRQRYRMVMAAEPPVFWRYYLDYGLRHLQYFDYGLVRADDVIINGGVHGGAEIPLYLARLGPRGRIYSADPFGFDLLDPYVRDCVAALPGQAVEWRVALSDRDGQMVMAVSSDGQVQHEDDRPGREVVGRIEVPCRSVDSLVAEAGLTRVNWIKFDLEGSEDQAIPGMAETLRRFRPSLAISIYHTPDHYWQLPEHLMAALPDYSFHLGHYSCERFETVLYALPPNWAG